MNTWARRVLRKEPGNTSRYRQRHGVATEIRRSVLGKFAIWLA